MKSAAAAQLDEGVTILGVEFGKNTKRLLGGLLSMGPLFIAARFFTALGQIAAGRLLGPEQYGLATMAVAAATLIIIPFNLGFAPGLVKFASMEENPRERVVIVSTALWANVAMTLPCLAVLYALRGPASALLHVSPTLYLWGLAYAAVWSIYMLLSSIPQALARFQARGWTELAYGAGALGAFLALFFAVSRGYEAFLISLIVALALAGAVALYASRDHIRLVFSMKALSRMSTYYLSPVVGSLSVALTMTATPLILAHYLSPASVGVLSIYELGTVGIAAVLAQILGTVLAPLTSAPSRQAGAWRKFFSLGLPVFAGCLLAFMVSDYAALRLVGPGYPIDFSWIALFSLAAALSIPASAASSLLTARDASGLWLATLGSILGGLASVAAIVWIVPARGFVGAAIAAVLSYAVSLIFFLVYGSKHA